MLLPFLLHVSLLLLLHLLTPRDDLEKGRESEREKEEKEPRQNICVCVSLSRDETGGRDGV